MNARLRQNLPALIPFLILVIICAILLLIADHLTGDRIEAQQRAAQLRLISEVMSLPHDNDLLTDRITIKAQEPFVTGAPITVYRARNNGQPTGLVFMPVPAKGYNGLIELAVGVAYDGELTGVRVHAHRETPGLGDQVHQDRSDWIQGFNGLSLQNTALDAWGVRSDGGRFDQISGATITPRGIIKAVRNTLDYYALHRNELYR